MNVYLVLEGDDALLLETGFTVHQDQIIAQLETLVPTGARRAICLSRPGEFNGICNLRPIAERFAPHTVHALYQNTPQWGDFRPDLRPFGTPLGDGALARVADVRVRPGDTIEVGGGRVVEVVAAAIQLLPSFWLYDETTRTLFTSEMFGWVSHPTESGPWIVTEDDDDPTDVETVATHLAGARAWWLPGARTDDLRRELAAVFDSREIETIAPGFGAILSGGEVVKRHYAYLDQVLLDAPERASIGIEAGRRRYNQ
jgi:hypothetical protein